MNLTKLSFLIIWPLAQVAEAQSQPPTLEEYLQEMDRAEVIFAGEIIHGGNGFALSSKAGYFFVNIDTGREQREFVEDNCQENWGNGPTCLATGTATVEIDGGSIELSINAFDVLRKVNNE